MTVHQQSPSPLFDLNTTPLDGVNLIEASAGTGKTYTIAAVFIRLIIEKEISVSQILVVTFTEAATEELKGRIRERIRQVIEFLSGPAGKTEDEFLRHLSQLDDSCKTEAVKRLKEALRDFDESAIFTIHGFCSRMLREHAFESGSLFDTELVADQNPLLQEISEDFWRNHFYDASPLFVRYAIQKTGPDDFRALLHQGRLLADICIIPPADAPELSQIEADFSGMYQTLRTAWLTDRQAVETLLLNDPGLNRNQYRVKSIPGWMASMDQCLKSETPRPVLFDYFFKFTTESLEKATKKNHTPLSHSFFDLCSRMQACQEELTAAYDRMLLHLKHTLFEYAREQSGRRKRQSNTQTFDDLLVNLKNALASDSGPALTESIRERHRAALIDEFQDTDPVQYEIFHTLFNTPGHILFLIGDPKQAIYGFRGADIFAYIEAAVKAEHRYTLGTNWRSARPLIKAVNTLFEANEHAFIYPEIPFKPVDAPKGKPDVSGFIFNGDPQPPFEIWMPAAPEKPISKGDARPWIIRSVAGEISRLLDAGRMGQAVLENPPSGPGDALAHERLRPGHIAVLVRRNREAEEMQQALQAWGIPSVLFNTGDIFDTPEAAETARVLSAIANPSGIRLMKTALASDMFGLTGEALENLYSDENEWDGWLVRFAEYRRTWEQQGFIRMFRRFLSREGVLKRLMALPDGERRCTNMLHLSELLHQASLQKKGGPSELLVWFSEQRFQRNRRPEEHPLRLESDDNAVKLVTIHKSKGLEYPIVFCPFTWDGSKEKKTNKGFVFYNETNERSLTLDLGSDKMTEHQQMLEKQRLAENLRLLYVALTRAKNRCCLVWGRFNTAETSAPAWLLHGQGIDVSNGNLLPQLESRFKALDDAAVAGRLKDLAEKSSEHIQLLPMPENDGAPYRASTSPAASLTARSFSGQIPRDFLISSFSALVSRHEYNPELADYDAVETTAPEQREESEEAALLPSGPEERNRFTFPRGAQAGTCLHEIFEKIDFTQSRSDASQILISETLKKYGFDPKWQEAVSDLVQNTLTAPLEANPSGVKLSEISPKQRINEMEFYFPTGTIRAETLSHLFSRYQDKGAWNPDFPAQIRTLDTPRVQGLMKGFIDLIFLYKGRYYLLDWKSNHLGDEVENYDREAIGRVMTEHCYFLQYHIYTIALHRYLLRRVKDYNYATHFGGVFYLFLRGIEPNRPEGFGLFYDRPAFDLVSALNQAMSSPS